jgi:hypothetical protein
MVEGVTGQRLEVSIVELFLRLQRGKRTVEVDQRGVL